MQQTALSTLTPATCKQLELTFQQLSQSHNAPAASAVPEDIILYRSGAEVKADNGPASVGSDFHNDSSTSESWVSTNQQQYQPGVAGGGGYAVNSPAASFSAASVNMATEAPDRKMSNRPTGPRKPKPQVVVSTWHHHLWHFGGSGGGPIFWPVRKKNFLSENFLLKILFQAGNPNSGEFRGKLQLVPPTFLTEDTADCHYHHYVHLLNVNATCQHVRTSTVM